jgi:C4-dicarboxylate-specific signal transduction histidine kinase
VVAKKDWKAFSEYEKLVNDSVGGRSMILLCTYALNSCGANELLDVVATHQFATARRRGDWELIETPELKQAKAEIKKMNDELESRVLQRTTELEAANHQLSHGPQPTEDSVQRFISHCQQKVSSASTELKVSHTVWSCHNSFSLA